MAGRGRTRDALWPWVIGIAAASLVACGVVLVVWGQKTAERLAYARAVEGPPCPAIARPPPYVHAAELKTGAFDGARFAYLRGDMDCQTAPVGDLADDHAAYCTFDRPGYLRVTANGQTGDYLLVIGQAVLARGRGGPWRCTTRPPP